MSLVLICAFGVIQKQEAVGYTAALSVQGWFWLILKLDSLLIINNKVKSHEMKCRYTD